MQKINFEAIVWRAVAVTMVSIAVLAGSTVATGPAQARVFIGFGFGFPGFVGPPIIAPPPPPIVYAAPPPVYAPPPVVRMAPPVVYVPPPPPVKHYRRPVRHNRVCRCYNS
jgi:hypothetical protein